MSADCTRLLRCLEMFDLLIYVTSVHDCGCSVGTCGFTNSEESEYLSKSEHSQIFERFSIIKRGYGSLIINDPILMHLK